MSRPSGGSDASGPLDRSRAGGESPEPESPAPESPDPETSDPETSDFRPVEELFPLVYDELLGIARRHLRRERVGHTLNTTALVHEAYLKMADQDLSGWRDRARLLAIASNAMRQILVDYARGRNRQKRGGGIVPITLRTAAGSTGEQTIDLLELDDALERLARLDDRLCKVVECRFFGGLTANETAVALDVSVRTVERDWTRARAHLAVLLDADPPGR